MGFYPEAASSVRRRCPQASNMGLDILADVDAADDVAQAWSHHVEMLVHTGGLAGNRTRRRIAVLDEPPRILFPKPVMSIGLCVGFCQPLLAEVQRAAFLRPQLSA